MPKIGRALKSVVEIESHGRYADKTRAGPSSPLMNANRRKVFQHICFHPCSGIEGIASGTGLSRSSVSWHLEQLLSSGYAELFLWGKAQIFAPVGIVQEHNIIVLSVLARKRCRSIFDSILENPGSDAKTLAQSLGMSPNRLRSCMNELAGSGLVVRVTDGRHARYFPTERFKELLLEMRAKSKNFIRKLMAKLAEERLKPEIKDMKRGNILIVLNILGEEVALEIPQRTLLDM